MHTELRQYIGHAQCFYCSKRYIFGLARSFFITARKRSLGQGNIFTSVCHSVHGRGMHARGDVHVGVCVHAWGTCVVGGVHARGCACLGGAWQGSMGGGGVHGQGGGECAWQERRPLQRCVRILMECILVCLSCLDFSTAVNLC